MPGCSVTSPPPSISDPFCTDRHAGLLIPLFSLASSRGWGIGEIPDLVTMSRWMHRAGLDLLLMLPVNEMVSGQHSPYSTLSAMAIDPIYIRMGDVAEFAAIGGEVSLDETARALLTEVRASTLVDYPKVRELKRVALRACFDEFERRHLVRKSPRRAAFEAFAERERDWLDDYAIFRALHERFDRRPWWQWPEPLAGRDAAAMAEARQSLRREIQFFEYVQWVADAQWHEARRRAAPVRLFGDMPFMVGADSADVWAGDHAFARDLSVGTPPDAFSEKGQDWGLPAYRWDVVVREDFKWLRWRAHRATELYDGYRVDHVIGFYRTWVRAADGSASFTPTDEADQRELGRRIMHVFIDSGACIVAEDLGTVPDFLRESLTELQVPGYKVFRWEREWNQSGQPFRDPAEYPPLSLATTGTHDTDTLAEWWDTTSTEEREAILQLPGLANRGLQASDEFGPPVRDALLELVLASGSNLVVLPVQDVFGWRDRINTPATVGVSNWTWRLPWPIDSLSKVSAARERGIKLKTWVEATGRSPASRDRRVGSPTS
jgi:4-alpha-glucanotransferase